MLGIKEVLEGSDAVRSGALSAKSFDDLCSTVEFLAGNDPGIGSIELHQELQRVLRSRPRVDSVNFRVLQDILHQVEPSYLTHWAKHIAKCGSQNSTLEQSARAIGSHLLDSGFSTTHLHH